MPHFYGLPLDLYGKCGNTYCGAFSQTRCDFCQMRSNSLKGATFSREKRRNPCIVAHYYNIAIVSKILLCVCLHILPCWCIPGIFSTHSPSCNNNSVRSELILVGVHLCVFTHCQSSGKLPSIECIPDIHVQPGRHWSQRHWNIPRLFHIFYILYPLLISFSPLFIPYLSHLSHSLYLRKYNYTKVGNAMAAI